MFLVLFHPELVESSALRAADAMYKAVEEFPDNPNVQRTLKAGLVLRTLHARTPGRPCQFLIDDYNQYHDGSSKSFVDMIKSSPKVRTPTW